MQPARLLGQAISSKGFDFGLAIFMANVVALAVPVLGFRYLALLHTTDFEFFCGVLLLIAVFSLLVIIGLLIGITALLQQRHDRGL